MKKFNFNISVFIYSFLVYSFYLVVYIFVNRSGYGNGLYMFAPAFLFAFYKLTAIGLWRSPVLMIYIAVPFFLSAYLSLGDGPAGWEVSGIIPLTVLSTFLFKSGNRPATPLQSVYMSKVCGMVMLAVISFSAIHFFRTGDLNSAVYLAISIYSPAPVLLSLALFVNFIISTAAISVILNNLELFNRGGKIRRLIFETDDFLLLPHLNLSGIETVKDVSRDDFLNKVEMLNEEAGKSEEYARKLKREKLFSKKFKEGYTLAMAPLSVMISSGGYDAGGLMLPEKGDQRSFIALAQDNRIIGYYAIDKITPSANSDILKVIDKKFGITSVIAGGKEEESWKECCDQVESFEKLDLHPDDLVISSNRNSCSSLLACWGGTDTGRGDLFIVKPFVSSILNLVIVASNISGRFFRGTVLVSIPFSFSLLAASMGLRIPQVSAASTMFSIVFTIFYVFYVKKRKRKEG